MRTLAEKTKMNTIILLDLVIGIVMLIGAVIVLPIGVFSIDKELLTNAFVWAVVLVAMLFFGVVGFWRYLRPFILFLKMPKVQAETDGEYLYLHSTKEEKIPLKDMKKAKIDVTIPYMLSHEFVIHLLSERYGKITIKVPKHGKFRLYHIANAQQAADEIAALAGIEA